MMNVDKFNSTAECVAWLFAASSIAFAGYWIVRCIVAW